MKYQPSWHWSWSGLKIRGLKLMNQKRSCAYFIEKINLKTQIVANNAMLTSKPSMNVLGVTFDSKLNWQTHIENATSWAKKALHTINLIRKHLSKEELLNLITSNYYSILYYNSEIWHIPSNTHNSKNKWCQHQQPPKVLLKLLWSKHLSHNIAYLSREGNLYPNNVLQASTFAAQN